MGDGRFGPVFLADDVDGGRPVVVRVFERADAAVTDALIEALRLLCSSPLDHPAIARPLACGIESGTGKALPFLVHSYLPGTPLDEFITQRGPQPLNQVVVRIAQVAASIDFAAAAGVHHGVLGARDIILNEDGAGITGLGLVQALSTAGIHVPGAAVSHADDIYALAAVAFQLLTGSPYRGVLDRPLAAVPGADPQALRTALASALAIDAEVRPTAALDFARALQAAVPVTDAASVPPVPGVDVAGNTRLHEPTDLAQPAAETATLDDRTLRFGDSPDPIAARADDVPAPHDRLFVPAPPPSRSPVLLAVAVALLAAIAGFAGGFAVGTRTVPTTAAGDEVQAAPTASPQPRPEGTQGRTFTDDAVEERPSASAPSGATPDTSAPPADKPVGERSDPVRQRVDGRSRTSPATPAPASAPAPPALRLESGSMDVLSRPSGAQVYVDGALVGQTPLLLPNVEPGAHAVRISLPGHQRWATSVDVRPGDRTRVAASLELVNDPQ
jgi:hypothetical protein